MKNSRSVLLFCASVAAAYFVAGCVAYPVAPRCYPIVERMPKLSGEYPVRAPVAVQSRDRLIGVWDMEYECNSISVCNTMADPIEISQMVKNRYEFYDDGVLKLQMKLDGKEFNHVGEWSYENGVIGMKFKNSNTGRWESMEMTALWYSDTEVELRYADLRAYERMFFVTPNVKSMNASYAPNGSLSTRMSMEHKTGQFTGISVLNMVYAPMIMRRTGEVESGD